MINTEIKESEIVNTCEYPYLGVFNGTVVLFWDPDTGIALKTGKSSMAEICEYRTDWVENLFCPFTGEITLCNATT